MTVASRASGPPRVQSEARLHEKALQSVARGDYERPRRGRGADLRPRQRVTVTRLHEEIRKRLRGIEPSRVQILSPTEVIIWNHPRKKPE